MPLSFGKDPDGVPRPLLVDASGRVLLAAEDSLGNKHALLSDSSGRLYIAVKADDKVFSYGGSFANRQLNTDLPAGNATLTYTAPVGTRNICLTQIAIGYVGTITNVKLFVTLTQGGVSTLPFSAFPVVSNQFYDRQGLWILAPGDTCVLSITGATLHDDAYLDISGYWMTP